MLYTKQSFDVGHIQNLSRPQVFHPWVRGWCNISWLAGQNLGKINLINEKKILTTELTSNLQRKKKKKTYRSTIRLLTSNQKLNVEKQATRPCVAVLVIFNTFLCSGITGGVQIEGGALIFNVSPIVALK